MNAGLAPTIEEIKKVVSKIYDIDQESLEYTQRGKVNEPRTVAIYLARKHSGLHLDEIGSELG